MTYDDLFKYTVLIGLSIIIAFLGKNRDIGYAYSFLISILLTPIVGILITLLSSRYRGVNPKRDAKTKYLGMLIYIIGSLFFLLALGNYFVMADIYGTEAFVALMYFSSGLFVLGLYIYDIGLGKSFAADNNLNSNNVMNDNNSIGLKAFSVPKVDNVNNNTKSDDKIISVETTNKQLESNVTNRILHVLGDDYLTPGDMASIRILDPVTKRASAYFTGKVVARGTTASGEEYVTFDHDKEHGKTYLLSDIVQKLPFFYLNPNAEALDRKTRVIDSNEMYDFIIEIAAQKNSDGSFTYTEQKFLSEFKDELDILGIKLTDLLEVFSNTRKSGTQENLIDASPTLNIKHIPNDISANLKTSINSIIQNVKEKKINSNTGKNKIDKVDIVKNIILYYIKHIQYYLIIPIILGLLISIGFNSGNYYGKKTYYYNNVGIGKVEITKQKYDAISNRNYLQINIGPESVNVFPDDVSIDYEIDWDGVIYKEFTYLLIGFLIFIGLIISYYIELRKYFE